MFVFITWLQDKKFSCKIIYSHFFVMSDLAIQGNSYSSYFIYCRGPGKNFRSGAPLFLKRYKQYKREV